MAELHPRLAQDCQLLGRFSLSRLLLMDDSQYPWFILVPDREGIREIHELSSLDAHQLLDESVLISRAIAAAFRPDKLNVAVLGNLVPQLHIHHVARYHDDPAWPGPVWGAQAPKAYVEAARLVVIESLKEHLSGGIEWYL